MVGRLTFAGLLALAGCTGVIADDEPPSGVGAAGRDDGAGPGSGGGGDPGGCGVADEACTCVSDTGGGEVCFASFAATVVPLSAEIRAEMAGRSWHPDMGCTALDDLRLIRLSHWGFDGAVRTGELVVAEDASQDVVAAFESMYQARYPIERMERIDAYDGDDAASMAANNTSAFNCRTVAGSSTLSQHAFGRAIDINPVQNPYVTSNGVAPPAGEDFVDRAPVHPGMIVRPGPTTSAFSDVGWGWGGDFSGKKDYQHFSANGK